jgi:hypothetical protein
MRLQMKLRESCPREIRHQAILAPHDSVPARNLTACFSWVRVLFIIRVLFGLREVYSGEDILEHGGHSGKKFGNPN